MRYSTDLAAEACALLAKGNTKSCVMDYLCIPSSTWYDWEKSKSEFSDAIKKAENTAIQRVESKLQSVAEKGNVTAIIFYLKNRKSFEWKDRQETELSGEVTMNVRREIVKSSK